MSAETFYAIHSWMDTITLVVLMTAFVLLPLAVLVHELGHAWAVIRLGRLPVVLLGTRRPPIARLHLKRMVICWHPLMDGGLCAYNATGLTVAEARRVINAGPRAMAGFALLCAVLALFFTGTVAYVLCGGFVASIWATMHSLVHPVYDGGHVTDGGHLRRLAELPPDAPVPREPHSQPPPRRRQLDHDVSQP
jgi:hypothetical protein